MPAELQKRTPLPIAVIDTETTGIYASTYDRIVEIGIVLLSPSGESLGTYETLLNPCRDLGPTHIHGITAAECEAAPTFKEIAGDILEKFDGMGAIAGLNIGFDLRFIAAEFKRIGVLFDHRCTTLCTYQLTNMGLSEACLQHGISPVGRVHSALTDARASSDLICDLARLGKIDLRSYCIPIDCPFVPAKQTPPVPRQSAQNLTRRRSGFIAELDSRAAFCEKVSDEVVTQYAAMLRRFLEDRVLDEEERFILREFIDMHGLSVARVRDIHIQYLECMTTDAWADQLVTEHELNDLERVARLLDLPQSEVESSINRVRQVPCSSMNEPNPQHTLAGASVCFSGTILSSLDGEVITRTLASDLAERAGLVVKRNVTKSLDILVVADPDTQSGKAKKARKYGTRIIAERDFWPMIGVRVS